MAYQIQVSDPVMAKLLDLADELAPNKNLDEFVDGFLRTMLNIHSQDELSDEDDDSEKDDSEPLEETGT